MTKKLSGILFSFVLLLVLVSCGKTDSASNSDLNVKQEKPAASGSDIAEPAEAPASDSDLTGANFGRTVTLYIPNSDNTDLDEVSAVIAFDEQSLFQALMKSWAFPEDWTLLQFSVQSDGKDLDDAASATDIHGTELIGYLDLNQAFLKSLKSATEAEETMYLASIVNTFIFNYNLGGLVLTVEGDPVETEAYSFQTPATPFVFH